MIKLATPSWQQVSSVLVQRANGSEVDSWMVEDITASELLDDLKSQLGPGRLHFPSPRNHVRVGPRSRHEAGTYIWSPITQSKSSLSCSTQSYYFSMTAASLRDVP